MVQCGHCNKDGIRGIKDHIKSKHGYMFYEMGPDFRYYGYEWLKEKDWLDPHQIHPAWEEVIDKEKLKNAVHRTKSL